MSSAPEFRETIRTRSSGHNDDQRARCTSTLMLRGTGVGMRYRLSQGSVSRPSHSPPGGPAQRSMVAHLGG